MARTKQKRRASDGRLQTSFTYEGKRYYVYGRNKDELKENELKKRQQLATGIYERKNPTLNSYYELFVESRRGKVSEMTIRTGRFKYKNCANVKIKNTGRTLGEMRIADVKALDILEVQKALQQADKGTTTINDSIYHLSHVFNTAIKHDIIEKNPCKSIGKLKRTETPAREKIHRALTEAETKAFFKAAEGSYYKNVFIVLIKTGMRIGELAALNHFDVDARGRKLHITKTVTKDEAGAYIIGDTPKTDAGNRDIPIEDMTIIYAIKEQQALNKVYFKKVSQETIFRSPENAILRDYSVNREIKRICKKAGIDAFTCHGFRATFATRFIEQRPQDYKILSEILGHSDTKITLNLYTHVMEEKKVTAMREINIAI